MRFMARRALQSFADGLVTSPLVRWTWTGPGNENIDAALPEIRPSDRETILEMMQGRYLLASKLVDTHGTSPFAVDIEHADWRDDLLTFAWLRHYRDARSDEERHFARMLALDWIEHASNFSDEGWSPSVTARRVLNWLRHFNILVDGAELDELRAIARSLATQVSSLNLRRTLAVEPLDALLVSIALVGVALCEDMSDAEVGIRVRRVLRQLDQQIDEDGLHLSRCARTQVNLLVELDTIRLGLLREFEHHSTELSELIESMHRALDAVSLGTGEPAYFNGTGQMPHDLIVSVQSQSVARARATGIVGGYGRLIAGRSIVVADSGQVGPPDFTRESHASALAFEFSHGRDLVVCNCGPAPADFGGDNDLFRQTIAHSAPSINALSPATIPNMGPMAGRLIPVGEPPQIDAVPDDALLVMTNHGYADRFGVTLERRLNLIADGDTLVGQDRFIRRRNRVSGAVAIRFHLAHQTEVQATEDMVRLRLASGAVWTFLWERAEMRIEDSVRQSAYFGFHRTHQIVLEAHAADTEEVSWIFTLEQAP